MTSQTTRLDTLLALVLVGCASSDRLRHPVLDIGLLRLAAAQR